MYNYLDQTVKCCRPSRCSFAPSSVRLPRTICSLVFLDIFSTLFKCWERELSRSVQTCFSLTSLCIVSCASLLRWIQLGLFGPGKTSRSPLQCTCAERLARVLSRSLNGLHWRPIQKSRLQSCRRSHRTRLPRRSRQTSQSVKTLPEFHPPSRLSSQEGGLQFASGSSSSCRACLSAQCTSSVQMPAWRGWLQAKRWRRSRSSTYPRCRLGTWWFAQTCRLGSSTFWSCQKSYFYVAEVSSTLIYI